MSTSNAKFRTGSKEAPTTASARVTACLRAIARRRSLGAFAAERPGLCPGQGAVPEPGAQDDKRDATIVRGHADSIALKLACHDPKVHRQTDAGNPQRAACSRRSTGAGGGHRRAADVGRLRKTLPRCSTIISSRQVRRDHRPADAPCRMPLAMMVREPAEGLAPPAAARKNGRSLAADPGGQDRRPASTS